MRHPFHRAILPWGLAALLLFGISGCSKPSNGEKMKAADMPGMPGMSSGDMKGMQEGEPAAPEKPGEFTVPVERQQQIGVTYATVERRLLDHPMRAVGKVMPDNQRMWRVVSRTAGYVDQLMIGAAGEEVKKGQPLLTIYSPELLTTENELLDAVRLRDASPKGLHSAREDAQGLLDSAKRRLHLWNITDEQIAKLIERRQAPEFLPILSPADGVVQALPVAQGTNIKAGDTLVDLADLSVVWVWGDFYQEELPMLKTGQEVTVTTSSYPGEKFQGQVSLVDPFINEQKRTARARLDIPNPGLKLKPEMYVNVELDVNMGSSLVVPVSAIMPTGKHNIAFVDKGEGKLAARFVEVGGKYGDFYAVTGGLTEGERVVTSANFLIDAESKVQGALKSW